VELPRLQALYEQYKDEGFEVVAVDTNRESELATAFIEKNGLTYTLLEDGEGDLAVGSGTFGVHEFPSSFLIDRDGRVVYFHVGFDPGDENKLEEEIKSLL